MQLLGMLSLVSLLTLGAASVASAAPVSNVASSNLVVDALFGASQNGDGMGHPCTNATDVEYEPDINELSWVCGSFVATCTPVEITTLDLALNMVDVSCEADAPSGVATATPATVAATGTILLTVAVTPASTPPSTSISVKADLGAIGGNVAQTFADDGSNGDAVAGDLVYSYRATLPLPAATVPGTKLLPVTIADAQARIGNATIVVNVLAPISPTIVFGDAMPAQVAPAASTLLTVAVTRGANPPSNTMLVTADLGAIGGSSSQSFEDNGSNGDFAAGDGVYSYRAAVPYPIASGPRSLPVTVVDAEQRSGMGAIELSVLASTNPKGFALASPDNLHVGESGLLTVQVVPGGHPSSTGIAVVADLGAIGGKMLTPLVDDGNAGDLVAGDGVYSHRATITGAAPGPYSLPVVVVDSQARGDEATIHLNVTASGGLSAMGRASPTPVTVDEPVALLVTVTPAVAPASTGVVVNVDLTKLGGDASATMFDDGTHGDAIPGDNVFALLGYVPLSLPGAPLRLPVSVADSQGRTAVTGIVIDVRGDSLFEDGFDE